MRDPRNDSGLFRVNVTTYAHVVGVAALAFVVFVAMVATGYLWLTLEVAAALLIFLTVTVLGIYMLLAEDE